ncbi:alpha/beta-hydrolase [Peniophora sp. CONT]|nr:alpha/beta-hydrolase [Peniophora sp. CONT]
MPWILPPAFTLLSCILLISRSAAALPYASEDGTTLPTLLSGEIAQLRPFTHYASAAYCHPDEIIDWSCEENCQANSHFQPFVSGGDGGAMQYWYVGYDAILDTVILAHQGTDIGYLFAAWTDACLFLQPIDDHLFPSAPLDAQVHTGFATAHARTAPYVSAAIQTVLDFHDASSVTVVGHSLGAALALLDGVYLSIHLPPEIAVTVIGYGMPRVGNAPWADFVDGLAPRLRIVRVNNGHDPVPIVPGQFLGYQHPSGELHIKAPDEWTVCPGQDNPSTECSVGAVPDILSADLHAHSGPYDGVWMGCGLESMLYPGREV